MSFTTGTANSPGDLLVSLFDFASANGYTVIDDISSSTQNPAYGTLQRGDLFVSFYFENDYIKIYPSFDHDSALAPNQQNGIAISTTLTNSSQGMVVNTGTGPFTEHTLSLIHI